MLAAKLCYTPMAKNAKILFEQMVPSSKKNHIVTL